jgi:hypothetical protein
MIDYASGKITGMTFEHSIEELKEVALVNAEMMYVLDASRKIVQNTEVNETYYCFICSQTDNKKVAVAYDVDTMAFHHRAGEHSQEAIWYFNTKEFLCQFASKDDGVSDIKEGVKLSSPETRAALYAKTRQGKTVAFEISSSVVRKPMPVKARHKAYQSKNIHDQWIYSHDTPHPFFSYDYKYGLVVDAATNRIGFIAVKVDSSARPSIDNAMFAQLGDTNLAHVVKYACWTDAQDWAIGDEGLMPKAGSRAHSLAISLVNNRRVLEQKKELEKSKRAELVAQHKEKALARAKERGIDPAKGHEVFIPPFEEPPYTTYPLTYGMLVEQAAYMAHMSPFDYIQHIIPASNQWDAYIALRNRWEETGKYDKSTFPDFELLRKSA